MSGRGGERERVRQNRWEGREGRRRGRRRERASGVNGGRGREWEMIHAVSEPPSAPARPSAAPDAAAQLPAAPGLPCPPSLPGSCARGWRGGSLPGWCGAAPLYPSTAGGRPGAGAATLGCTAETLKAGEVRTVGGGTRTGVYEGRRGGGWGGSGCDGGGDKTEGRGFHGRQAGDAANGNKRERGRDCSVSPMPGRRWQSR